ncbi:hypothetical protein ACWC98_37660 [Streptomyces goshikiensis]
MKKIATAAGVATAGIALFVTTQGSAQAAQAQPVAPVTSVQQEEPDSPQVIGSVLGKAATSVGKVAAKNAHKAVAVGKGMAVVANSSADNMLAHGRIIGSSPADLPAGVDASTVFDR